MRAGMMDRSTRRPLTALACTEALNEAEEDE